MGKILSLLTLGITLCFLGTEKIIDKSFMLEGELLRIEESLYQDLGCNEYYLLFKVDSTCSDHLCKGDSIYVHYTECLPNIDSTGIKLNDLEVGKLYQLSLNVDAGIFFGFPAYNLSNKKGVKYKLLNINNTD